MTCDGAGRGAIPDRASGECADVDLVALLIAQGIAASLLAMTAPQSQAGLGRGARHSAALRHSSVMPTTRPGNRTSGSGLRSASYQSGRPGILAPRDPAIVGRTDVAALGSRIEHEPAVLGEQRCRRSTRGAHVAREVLKVPNARSHGRSGAGQEDRAGREDRLEHPARAARGAAPGRASPVRRQGSDH